MAQFRRDTHQYLNNGNTIFEVIMLADQYGGLVGPANPSGMAVDAFGRARTSTPFTLFDSQNRYRENEKFATSNTATGNTSYDANTSIVSLNVDTTSAAEVIRESTRVFAYQPGKSLQVFNTFVMGAPKSNLRQRVGYFDDTNGIFIEQDDSTINFVKRNNQTDTAIAQSSWNIDKLDGTGPSLKTLDLTKAQIMFIDIEWLGVGSVRVGFVIDGQLIHCHSFHHSNIIDSTYMTTACLPIRYEIKNTDITDSASTLKQICSSVISEGGYELRGEQHTIGTGILTANLKDIPTAGTFIPVVSVRLKSDHLDSIAVLKQLQVLGVGNNTRLEYKIVKGTTLSAGTTTFTSAGAGSCIEYNVGATAYTGGRDLKTFYSSITNQSVSVVDLGSDSFDFQFERDGLANTATIYTIAATGAANGDDVAASIDWEEFV